MLLLSLYPQVPIFLEHHMEVECWGCLNYRQIINLQIIVEYVFNK